MEAAGANRDVSKIYWKKNNLIYYEYLGDDDTSSFKAAADSKPYEKYNITPTK